MVSHRYVRALKSTYTDEQDAMKKSAQTIWEKQLQVWEASISVWPWLRFLDYIPLGALP